MVIVPPFKLNCAVLLFTYIPPAVVPYPVVSLPDDETYKFLLITVYVLLTAFTPSVTVATIVPSAPIFTVVVPFTVFELPSFVL